MRPVILRSLLIVAIPSPSYTRCYVSHHPRVSFAKEPYKIDLYSAKETYNFKEPTNRSHPIRHLCLAASFSAFASVSVYINLTTKMAMSMNLSADL